VIQPVGELLRDHVDYGVKTAKLAEIDRLIEENRRAEQRARAQIRAEGATVLGDVVPGRRAMERVGDYLKGGVVSAADPAHVIAACVIKHRDLVAARQELAAEVDDIVSHKAYEVMCGFREHHHEMLRAALDGLAMVHDAYAGILELQARFRQAGYPANGSVLATYFVPVLWQIGDPRQASTQSGLFRRWLEEQDIIKEGSL